MTIAAPITIDDDALRRWPLPQPGARADKVERGTVLVVAGSAEMPGAAALAAEAALRAGAGRVVVATVAAAAPAVAAAVPELRVVALPATADGGVDPAATALLVDALRRADALLIGPGMLDEPATVALATALRRAAPALPLVLDATAIAAVDTPLPGCAPPLITPHAGEMAHTNGDAKRDVQVQPLATAAEAAARLGAFVALKGALTVIAAPDGRLWQHRAAVPGLATAGSGDVLAGIVAALAARGAPLEQAAAWGVALHARAGQRLAARRGSIGFLARELGAELPCLLDELGDAVDKAPGAAGTPAAAVPGHDSERGPR